MHTNTTEMSGKAGPVTKLNGMNDIKMNEIKNIV